MPRGEHRSSILLTQEENDQVFSLIGPKCQSMATAVVQLFTTEGPGHSEWKKKDTGILCLIKDNGKRSYFFRIYCLHRKTMIWEHEVYTQIEYKSPRPYLHTFEAEEYMTAFNFANEGEARVLKSILIEKIELRKQRREERRQKALLAAQVNSATLQAAAESRSNGASAPVPLAAPAPLALAPKAMQPPPAQGFYTLKPNKKSKTRKLTKADIGTPQDFKHVSHVGWDPAKGFDIDMQQEDDMRSFLMTAGVSESQLQDTATRKFIYDFIKDNGGLDAVKEALHAKPSMMSNAPPAVPAPPAPPPPAPPARSPAPHHPPAPPSRAPPPPPARVLPPLPAPPGPPPYSAPRNPPPPRPMQPPSSAPPSVPPPPPPAPPSGAPPPPPPPPPPTPPAAPPAAPPPPPPMPAEASGGTDARAALMESIRSGNKNLKHVEVGSKNTMNGDNRSNLLSEIRQGIELKSVSRSSSNQSPAPPQYSGLAGALRRALTERARVIHSSDSELSDETTSDGEWDD